MRILLRALLLALLLPGEQLLSQHTPAESWPWWGFAKNRQLPRSLLILPNASEAAAKDRAREGAKQREEDRLFFQRFKYERLLFYRTERERAINARIARVAAEGPFQPPQTPPSAGTAGAPADLATGGGRVPEAAAPGGADTTDRTPPPPTSDPATPLEAIDNLVDRAAQQLTGQVATAPTRSAMFVMLIVAMFMVPAVALTMLLLAASHVRARLWGRAFIFAALGGFVAWGAISAARQIAPEAPGLSITPAWLQRLAPWSDSPRG